MWTFSRFGSQIGLDVGWIWVGLGICWVWALGGFRLWVGLIVRWIWTLGGFWHQVSLGDEWVWSSLQYCNVWVGSTALVKVAVLQLQWSKLLKS